MIRYSCIDRKNNREIVLLKGNPCIWGRCSFCDYISDNSSDEEEMAKVNHEVLKNITGKYKSLEVINSGSAFELPKETLLEIKDIVHKKGIRRLYLESYYAYRDKLDELKDFFGVEVIFKCGIETFDDNFRNKVLKKGIVFKSAKDVAKYFDSICLLVGVEGQTKDMIKKDINVLIDKFKYGCINIYNNNTTAIKADYALQDWFKKEYSYLDDMENIEVLWNNTDFGVGGDAL